MNFDFDSSVPNITTRAVPRDDRHDVKRQYDKLKKHIQRFEDSLDNEHKVIFRLASFSNSITMSVNQIGYENPDLIIFDGFVGSVSSLV